MYILLSALSVCAILFLSAYLRVGLKCECKYNFCKDGNGCGVYDVEVPAIRNRLDFDYGYRSANSITKFSMSAIPDSVQFQRKYLKFFQISNILV